MTDPISYDPCGLGELGRNWRGVFMGIREIGAVWNEEGRVGETKAF